MTKGRIVAVKRFEIHDGDGIRTTLFLKGCPLRCVWCHNPEAISPRPQLAYLEKKCIGCGECVALCAAHRFTDDGKHVYDRDTCVHCGRCAAQCLGDALTFYGKEVSPEDVLPLLTEDRIFYDGSGGGVTLSGGEPLMQADFCRELLGLLKAEGIHTALDTCAYASREQIDKVTGDTDVFLCDVKFHDEQEHIRYTGKSNRIILDNLRYIDSLGKPVEIRIPLIPTVNDNQLEAIGRFLSGFDHITRVKVLPYHDFAAAKYESLAMENTLPAVPLPGDDQLDEAVSALKSWGLNAVSGRA